MQIQGQAAVVTGGASGLGEGTARMLVANGAKVVIADMHDWEFAQEMIAKYNLTDRAKEILVSPVHGVDLPAIADAVSRSGLPVRLNLQLHKYIWGAEARGV